MLKTFLSQNSFWTINKPLVKEIGLIAAAIFTDMIDTFVFLDENHPDKITMINGKKHFFLTSNQIEDRFGIKRKAQAPRIKILKDLKLIEIVRKGVPARNFIHLQEENIKEFFMNLEKGNNKIGRNGQTSGNSGFQPDSQIGQNDTSSLAEMAELDRPKRPPINNPIQKPNNNLKEKYKKEKEIQNQHGSKMNETNPDEIRTSEPESGKPKGKVESSKRNALKLSPEDSKKIGAKNKKALEGIDHQKIPQSFSHNHFLFLLEWLEYKHQLKSAYVSKGLEVLIKKLSKYSVDVLEASFEESASNTWSGLFPEKILKDREMERKFSKKSKPLVNPFAEGKESWNWVEHNGKQVPEWYLEYQGLRQ